MVEVVWTDARGAIRTAIALLEDISQLGVCLQLDVAIPLFAVVLINLNGVQTRAMVRYCRWCELGYFAGLTFAPGAQWSRERFQPKHLTDLANVGIHGPERVV